MKDWSKVTLETDPCVGFTRKAVSDFISTVRTEANILSKAGLYVHSVFNHRYEVCMSFNIHTFLLSGKKINYNICTNNLIIEYSQVIVTEAENMERTME